METHWPSLQVKDPEPQEVTFTRVFLEFDLAVQGSSVTVEKSKSCNPSNIEISDEVLENDFFSFSFYLYIIVPHSYTLIVFLVKPLPNLLVGIE